MTKNDILAALFICAILSVLIVGIAIGKNETTTVTYATVNDGGYAPVYKVKAPAIRIADIVEVEWNGEAYSAYVETESEIQTGDMITCTFLVYEGNVELINIQ